MTATLTRMVVVVAALLAIQGCGSDDGASTREAGSVVIIGSPPPGGGGSVSAVGAGCTTRGATTKKPAQSITIGLDEYSVSAPAEVPAGVSRLVVKNFGSDPHEIVITLADSADELPFVDGAVDIDALPNKVYRVMEFAGNTICEGTFELPTGSYVVFSNLAGAEGSDYERGMVATFLVI